MAKPKLKPIEGDIIAAMDGPFADWFEGPSWNAWRVILKAAHALEMTPDEVRLFHELAGGRPPPKQRVRDLFVIGGRRGGKDSVASLIVTHAAAMFNGKRRTIFGVTLPALRKGERATVFCIARDREQAAIVLRYVELYFDDIPELRAMVTRRTRDTIELANGVDIVVGTADYRGIRGRAVLCCVLDELAFFRDELSATPDIELYNAIEPGFLTLKDQAMMIGISSAHKKSGLLYDMFRECYGVDDAKTLVIKATSLQLNPTLDAATIEAEIAKDPDLKRAEYLCEWRDDLSSFVLPEIVDAAIMRGVAVIPPDSDKSYMAFIDVSGGAKDAHTCAVAFRDKNGVAVLASAREIKTPDTTAVAAEFSALLKSYGCSFAYADEYGKNWVTGAFSKFGIELRASPYTRSQIYLEFLPALNSGKASLLDLPRLRQQLLALERTTSRTTGRDQVNHPNAGHDDLINAAAGALVMVDRGERNTIHWVGGGGGVWDKYLEQANRIEEMRRDDPVYDRRDKFGQFRLY